MDAFPILIGIIALALLWFAVWRARVADRRYAEEHRRRLIDERLAAANGRPYVDRLQVEPAARRDD